MISSKRLWLALLLTAVAQPCFAVLPPQAKLLDNAVSPPCVIARPSWLAQGKAGPAVSLTNKCQDEMVVEAIATHTIDTPEAAVNDPRAVLAARVDGIVHYDNVQLAQGVKVQPLETLIVPVSWGTHYSIKGYMPGPDKRPLSATGWMIDPANPAQAMDIIGHEVMKPK